MEKPQFVYVTYISTTPEKVWNAITDPKITEQYWQHANVSDWQPGSRWEHREANEEHTLKLIGKIVESEPPRRLVMTWAQPVDEAHEEKHSRVTFEIAPHHDVVKLTVMHDHLGLGAETLEDIAEGWPIVLSSLKTFLESGQPLPKLWD